MSVQVDSGLKEARLSECGRYRYSLSRAWDMGGDHIVWVMLNPSTADAYVDDPTIRRCVGFSQRWGFGEMRVVNLYAIRSPHPLALLYEREPVGDENDGALASAAVWADRVVVGWGAIHRNHHARARIVTDILRSVHRNPLRCVGRTKEGWPRHPLYVRSDAGYQPYTFPNPNLSASA